MDYEKALMNLIANSGDARSKSLIAMSLAKSNQLSEAYEILAIADQSIEKADQFHQLIREKYPKLSLLAIHAQDHYMNAMIVKELAKEFIDIYQLLLKEH